MKITVFVYHDHQYSCGKYSIFLYFIKIINKAVGLIVITGRAILKNLPLSLAPAPFFLTCCLLCFFGYRSRSNNFFYLLSGYIL
jgi:hypothetical protein